MWPIKKRGHLFEHRLHARCDERVRHRCHCGTIATIDVVSDVIHDAAEQLGELLKLTLARSTVLETVENREAVVRKTPRNC